jgi:hypothetical protein
MKGNLINYFPFLNFVIPVEGGLCDYAPRAPKSLATLLLRIYTTLAELYRRVL